MQSHHLPVTDGEEEIRRLNIPSATVFWRGPYSFTAAAGQAGGGLYVIVIHGNRPVYVGQTASFRARFLTRIEVLRQTGCDLGLRRAYLGTILLPKGGVNSSSLRLDLESVLIRFYLRKGVKLTNRSSVLEFVMGPKEALINNLGSRPPQMAGQIVLRRNERFELGSVGNKPAGLANRSAAWQFEEPEEGETRRRKFPSKRFAAPRDSRPFRPRPRTGSPRLRRIPRPPRRPLFGRRPTVIHRPYEPCPSPPPGSEYVRWVQSSLNQILGTALPITGLMTRATRDALEDFQKQEGLTVDGIAGPETKQALLAAKTSRRKSN